MQRTITPTHLKGMVSLVTAAMLYGMFGILSRVVGYNLPLYYQNWTRNLVAALILVWTFRQWKAVRLGDWKWIVLRSFAGIGAFLLFFISANIMELGLMYFVFYGGSIVGGFILGSLLFKERTTRLRLFCLGLAFIGLLLVYGNGASLQEPWHVALPIFSGIFTSFWNTATKKVTNYEVSQLTFLDNFLAVPVYFILSLIFRESWPLTEFSMVQGASLLIGVLFVATGILVVYGFRRLDAQVGSLILLIEILFAIFFGYLFYRELPSAVAAAGGMLILIAMMLPEFNWNAVLERAYAYRRKTDR